MKSRQKLGDKVPSINIQSNNDGFALESHDIFYRFLPLRHGAEAEVATYEYPSQQCAEISRARVHEVSHRYEEPIFRVSESSIISDDAELSLGATCDFYYSVRGRELFTEAIIEGAYGDDVEYMQYQDGPEVTRLTPGQVWAGKSVCREHPNDAWKLDIKYENRVDSHGFSVSIGTRKVRCIKVTTVAHAYSGAPRVRL